MKYKETAFNNYKYFCSLEGSDYIASEFALETILKLIKEFKVVNILELGLGIGSVSDTVFKFAKNCNLTIEYVGTEKNDFCLKAISKNVEDYKKIHLFPELNKIDNSKFEFIIIDGYDNSFDEIEKYCSKNSILYVEGDRAVQTKKILDIFPKSLYVNVITLKKNPPYAHESRSVDSYIGGGQLIFTNPTVKMKFFWFKEKISTFIKRKLRD
jgi:spore coat polysaccharide biosynthesis predicted glycosyltransferase SpsG